MASYDSVSAKSSSSRASSSSSVIVAGAVFHLFVDTLLDVRPNFGLAPGSRCPLPISSETLNMGGCSCSLLPVAVSSSVLLGLCAPDDCAWLALKSRVLISNGSMCAAYNTSALCFLSFCSLQCAHVGNFTSRLQ